MAKYGEKKFDQGVENCLRLYPHLWDCQPFFLCEISG
jgi:hypothetical protein